jgi:16S rRNA (guanine1207-N2)-methyltransferase
MARARLAPGGTLAAAMPNTAGASRFEKELSQATGGVSSIQKHKCRAFLATENGAWNEPLFSQWADLGKPMKLPDSGFLTQAGVFSSAHIDPGSLLLASHLPAHLHGTLADLGAGWGFLTDAALRKCPGITRADLYEEDSRALACARENLSGHTADTRFLWHDVTTGLKDTYDVILMNPPFHTGQNTDVGLGRAFLTRAAAALKRGGRLLLVANRQLPYESILESHRLSWRKTAEDRVYKILVATKL